MLLADEERTNTRSGSRFAHVDSRGSSISAADPTAMSRKALVASSPGARFRLRASSLAPLPENFGRRIRGGEVDAAAAAPSPAIPFTPPPLSHSQVGIVVADYGIIDFGPLATLAPAVAVATLCSRPGAPDFKDEFPMDM
jgi:hypothetical protein